MSEGPARGLESRLLSDGSTMRWSSMRENLMRYFKLPLWSPNNKFNCYATCKPATLVRKRIRVLMVVGLFSVLLREAIELGRPQKSLGNLQALAVPTSTSIPFHSMMDIPLPFSPGAATKFASCHVAKMTTVDFLADGEWAGVISMSLGQDGADIFYPPMHDVHFSATASSEDPTILELHGTGVDAAGHFDLRGKVATDTGQISLRQKFTDRSLKFDYACFMAPMGIIGSWRKGGYSAWIWLWKASWTAGQ